MPARPAEQGPQGKAIINRANKARRQFAALAFLAFLTFLTLVIRSRPPQNTRVLEADFERRARLLTIEGRSDIAVYSKDLPVHGV